MINWYQNANIAAFASLFVKESYYEKKINLDSNNLYTLRISQMKLTGLIYIQ